MGKTFGEDSFDVVKLISGKIGIERLRRVNVDELKLAYFTFGNEGTCVVVSDEEFYAVLGDIANINNFGQHES
jgi:hypothetical protein